MVLEFVERCTIDFLCVPLLSGNMVSRVEQSTAVQSVVNECLVDSSSFLSEQLNMQVTGLFCMLRHGERSSKR